MYSHHNGTKLEINNIRKFVKFKRKFGKFESVWKLNNAYINNQSVKKQWGKMKTYFEVNENLNTMYQNLWNAAKAVLMGESITVNNCEKKEKSKQSQNSFSISRN